MADQGYRRPKRFFFDHVGVNVNSPIDAPSRPRRLYRMKNITVEIDGSLTTRPGCANLYAGLVVAGQTPCHSERRISDDESGLWARVIGTGTHLAVELSTAAGTTSSIDTGYSGNPFTSAAWRPSESAKLHLYVADDSRMRKVDITGVDKQIGLPAPVNPPVVELGRPYHKRVSDMETVAAWTQGGVAGAPILVVGKRIDTTLEASTPVIWDDAGGSTGGWGCFRPVNLANIGPGSLLTITAGIDQDTVRVGEVHRSGSATTIGSIVYESGSTGMCVIQPLNGVVEFVRNAVVKLVNGGTTEYCRILSVLEGINGNRSFRISTTNTWAATHSIQIVNSFRAYTVTIVQSSSTSGALVTQEAIQSTSSAAGAMTLTDTVSVDLTTLESTSPGIPMYDDDLFSLSFRAADLALITNVRAMFSLDGTFTENFYYRTIDQSVLVAAAKNTQTSEEVRRRQRQRQKPQVFWRGQKVNPYDETPGQEFVPPRPVSPDDPFDTGEPNPVVPSGETGTGDNQWSELRWTRRQCLRSGTDQSKGWKDVVAVRIEVTVTAASVVIMFNSLNVSGGFEPNVGDIGEPYQYRYRGRDSTTGVVSDFSPECLEKLTPQREQVVLTLPTLSASEIDKIDVERYGGTQSQWLLVGTVDNGTSTFTDKLSDLSATANAAYSDKRVLQPWPRFAAPLAGTATTVAGNMVKSSTSISTSIIPGTRIIVNGIATSIRRIISSAPTQWELTDSIGSATNVDWEIAVPVLAGQPLGAMWRHDTNTYSVMFACDGPFVRWSLGNNPDASRDINFLEVTQSNDPTVMGFSYNGRCGVFTTSRLIWLTGDPVNGFRKDEVPNGHGLFSRWALAVGKRIGWLAKDGVYETGGGEPDTDIVDMDLGPLFVNEEGGAAPTSINGVKAPKITSAEAPNLRLDYADDGSLMFFYRDQSANRACLRYVPHREGWLPYEFGVPLVFIHSEEGEGIRSLVAGDANGKLHLIGGASAPAVDDSVGVAFELQPFSENFGDARPNKRIGDTELDVNPNGQTINVEIGYDNHTSTTALTAITGASQVQRLYDLTSGDGRRARNVSIRLHGTTIAGNRPKFFSWEPSVMEYPADTILRATSWHDAGYPGDKYMQGIIIHADTYNQSKTIRIEKDGGTLIDTIVVQHNGERRESYSFDVTSDALRTARLVRIATADTDPWTLIDWQWVFNREPGAAKVWEIQYSGIDARDYFHVFQIMLAINSSAATTMETFADGTLIDTTTVPSTSGVIAKPAPFVMPAVKTKLIKWRLESTADFRLYQRDCAIWVMPYAGQDYSVLRPFGDVHRDEGARL